MTYQPDWRQEDEQRVRSLECLYIIDGRGRKDENGKYIHPMNNTYTGLWLKYRGPKANA
jgi:hypothetical protein